MMIVYCPQCNHKVMTDLNGCCPQCQLSLEKIKDTSSSGSTQDAHIDGSHKGAEAR